MKIKIKKTHPDAIVPSYATIGAACFDLHSVHDGIVGAGSSTVFTTGLCFEIPKDHVMLIHSRSGHGFKSGIRLANVTGVLDSDYRGVAMIKLHNDSYKGFHVNKGDRIAQAMIIPVNQVEFEEVEELGDTERGIGGFGSTGQ